MLALDGQGVRDLLAYRRCLELGAAELAAERATEAQIAELAAAIERCEANASPESYDQFRAADGRFHLGLAHIAGSPRLVAGITEVRADMANLLDSVPRQPEALVGSTTHHRRVLAAIAEHDGEGARLAMREHLDATERLLFGLLPSV
jgi:GntR family transcriptional repressor for pyruvate dehydrogenase complex